MQQDKEPVLSAGVIIARFIKQEPHYLLLRAYNYWDFPKGIVEPGEEPLQGAIREVEEETTLTDLRFVWGFDYRETPPYRGYKTARYYIAATDSCDVALPVSEELGHPEHDEYRWLPYHTAHGLLNERVQRILQWAHQTIRGV